MVCGCTPTKSCSSGGFRGACERISSRLPWLSRLLFTSPYQFNLGDGLSVSLRIQNDMAVTEKGMLLDWMQQIKLHQYLDLKKQAHYPDTPWCILVHSSNSILSFINLSFKSLHGEKARFVEQNDQVPICGTEMQCIVSVKEVSDTGMNILPTAVIAS